MVKVHLIITAFLMCLGMASAQDVITRETASSRYLKQLDEAKWQFDVGNNAQGMAILDELLRKKPGFIDALMMRSTVCQSMGDFDCSASSLERAVELAPDYDTGNLYRLALVYAQLVRYGEAKSMLNDFMAMSDLDARQKEIIDQLIEEYTFRDSLVANPVAFQPVPLPGEVNSDVDEALPALTVDGARMLFVRHDRRQEDLYTAVWDTTAKSWTSVKPMRGVNSEANEGAPSLAADGSVIAFTACGRPGGLGGCDIYVARRRADGSWERAQSIGELNSPGWDAQPALTPDGNGMYFSSDRPGGLGKRDLWYSEYQENGIWSSPINCGSTLNTSDNESSPFLAFDGASLYFMSDGHKGMGDYDIFISQLADTGWSKPQNLGYPINTPRREGGLSIHPNAIDAFYTVEETRGGTMDLYTFELDPAIRPSVVSYLKALVINAADGTPVTAQAIVYPVLNPDLRTTFFTDRAGQFTAAVPHGQSVGIHITAEGYLFYSEQFDLADTIPYARHERIIELTPMTSDAPDTSASIVLNNLQFAFGDSSILETSVPELQLVLDLLEKNPQLQIRIEGHTDNIGSPEANLTLSRGRAKAVISWLVDHGISPERLSSRGYGETQPIAPNDTEEGRRLNRRTELVLL